MPTIIIEQAFELALQHHQAGRLAEAEALYRQILAVQPNHADALHLLGVVAHQVGQQDLAVALIRQALVLDPIYPKAHSNLGEVYRALGRLDEAIASYRRALNLQPDYPEAENNLGNALIDRGQFDEAVGCFRRALVFRPDYPEAHSNLGIALARKGEIDEAIVAFRRAIQLRPEHPFALSYLIYTLLFHPAENRRTIALEKQCWNRRFGKPLRCRIQPHANDRDPERRLRVGYVSPDFRDHVVGRNLMPLFRNHDRQRFEIVCYAGAGGPDIVTEEYRKHADQWRSTVCVTDEALVEMIRQDGVDILVDLTQHMSGNRLPMFARQPAPVQVSFACYPESTGMEAIPCRISDHYLEGSSAEEEERKEQMYLIDSFWCYDPAGVELDANALPAKANGRMTFGSLNNFCKINEPLLKLWARVLREFPDSRLVILSAIGSHRRRTLEFLEREGVEPQRVEFVEPRPRNAYLELYHRLDVVLDTFPYNGHTTSLDALWMGVPVVSLAGERPVSRAGLSQLSNLGLPELVAHSENDFVAIARQLAGDLPRLAELRRTLRSRMKASVLMDGSRFARSIETAYRAMWRRWCAEAPVSTPSF